MANSYSSKSSDDFYISKTVSGEHGFLYQKNLFIMLFERLTRKGFNFQLAYEMDAADKFDDIVVFLKDAENENDESWFIQTKHKDTSFLSEQEQSKQIMYESLFPKEVNSKGEFNLYKYLKSYSIIKSKYQGKKKVFIVTNRELLSDDIIESSKGRIKIVPRTVDEMLDCGGENVGLEMNEKMIKEIQDNVNEEFIELRDAVLKLIEAGTVDPVIINYKTPLADIIEKLGSSIRIKTNSLDKPELNQFYEALRQVKKDFETSSFVLDEKQNYTKQINSIFCGQSKNKQLPKFVDQYTVKEFFTDLVLVVKQPDDLLPVISADLQVWMKTWLRPEYFGKLDKDDLQIPVNEFTAICQKLKVEKQLNRFLKLSDGKKCLTNIKAANKLQQKEFCPFYINRRIRTINSIVSTELSDNDFIKELTGKFGIQKFFILSAEPGMGKTTVCQYLAHRAQQIPNKIVCLIYFNELQQKLEHFENINNLKDVLSVFDEVISKAHCESIEHAFNSKTKQIVFFFDGFDEIAVEDRDKVLKMFKLLRTISNLQLVIDGRRHVKDLLEEQFGVNAMSLASFEEKDQICFLRKFWKVSENDEDMFLVYSRHLLNLLDTHDNRALYKFTGLPLTLKMLAEVRKDEYLDYLKSGSVSQKTVGIVDLYETFIEQSFRNKRDKLSNEWKLEKKEFTKLFQCFMLEHQLLAIKNLKIISWQEVTKIPKAENEYNDFHDRIQKQEDKSPLVEFINNQIQFVHLSYAEFLVAQFLYLHVEKFQSELFSRKNSPFGNENFKMVRRFFFALLEKKQNTTHLIILMKPFKRKETQNWILEVYGRNTVLELVRAKDGSLKNSLAHEVLIEAAKFYEVFKFLIEEYGTNININYKGSSGETAFSVAAIYGDEKTVKLLLEKKADINCTNRLGETPLHLALNFYHWSIVKLLIKHNTNLKVVNNLGQTAVHSVISRIKNFKAKMVYWSVMINASSHTVTEYVDNKKRNENKIKILNEMLQLLIEALDDVNAAYKQGKTLLHHAAEEGVEEAVAHLLNRSADLTVRDINKQTPLHLATLKNHIQVVKLLLEKSKGINFADKDGLTPLHIAAREGFKEVVELLMENNAELNAQDLEGRTPCRLAELGGHFKISKLFE